MNERVGLTEHGHTHALRPSPRTETVSLAALRLEDVVEQSLAALGGDSRRALLLPLPTCVLYDAGALAMLSHAAGGHPSGFARLHFQLDLRLVLAEAEHLARVQRKFGASGLRLATEIGIDSAPLGAELVRAGVRLLLVPEPGKPRSPVTRATLEHARYIAALARAHHLEAAAVTALAKLVPAIGYVAKPWECAGIPREHARVLFPAALY